MIIEFNNETGKKMLVDNRRRDEICYAVSHANEDLKSFTEIFKRYSFPITEELLRNVANSGCKGVDKNAEDDARSWAKSANYPDYLIPDVLERAVMAIHTPETRPMFNELEDAYGLFPYHFSGQNLPKPDGFSKEFVYDKKKQLLQLSNDYKDRLIESCIQPIDENLQADIQPFINIINQMRELDRKGWRTVEIVQEYIGSRYQDNRRPPLDVDKVFLTMMNNKCTTSEELMIRDPEMWQHLNKADNPELVASLYRNGSMRTYKDFSKENPDFAVSSVTR